MPWSGAGNARRSWWPRRAIPAGQRSRRFAGAARRSGRALSERPHLGGATADDDDAGRRQRTCGRDRGHFRRLPGAGEGLVQPPRVPRPRPAVGGELDQLGRVLAQVVYYFTAAAALGAPAPPRRLHGSDRQFRRRLRRLCGDAHGPAGRSAGHRHQCQRYPGAHARDRHLRGSRRDRDLFALDGHPGLVQFRAAAVRCLRPRCGRGARVDGLACAVASLRHPARRARGDPRPFSGGTRRRRGNRGDDPHVAQGDRLPVRSAHRRCGRGGREGSNDPAVPDGRAVDRASGEIPGCGRGGVRRTPGAAGLACRSAATARADHRACGRPGRGRTVHSGGKPRRPRGAAA